VLGSSVLQIRRRTVELDHHMRLCDIRSFAGTNVWEQGNATWREGRALTYAWEDTVERLS
jgi:hypothetical protein